MKPLLWTLIWLMPTTAATAKTVYLRDPKRLLALELAATESVETPFTTSP